MLPRRRGQVGGSIANFLVSLRSRKVNFPVESTLWSAIWAGRRPRAGLRTRFLDSATSIYVKTVLLSAIDLAGNSLLQQLLTAPAGLCQNDDVSAICSKPEDGWGNPCRNVVLTQTCWCREKLLLQPPCFHRPWRTSSARPSKLQMSALGRWRCRCKR